MYKTRDFNENDTAEIKCRILEGGLYSYTGRSICHETVEIGVEEKFRDEESFELEKGSWYCITTEIEDYEKDLIKVEIDSGSDVELIGDKVNDWRGQIRNDRNIRSSQPTPSSGNGGIGSKLVDSVNKFRSMSMGETKRSTLGTESIDSATATSDQNIEGFATGGAKDVENFRRNIKENYIPEPDSMTYEGLFYEYEFEISGDSKESTFYPVYEHANLQDPISQEVEHFLALGLESGIDSFRRPSLDLMLVLDVSGSMSSPMRNYHYDNENQGEVSQKSKMQATIEVVNQVVEQLEPDDRVGVVLYNDNSYISKPIRKTGLSDLDEIKGSIEELQEGGGTNLSNGFESAVTEMRENADIETSGNTRESRIMFFTDAMPNTGRTDTEQLTDRMSDVAQKYDIHTTFVGVGIDANPEFINDISGIKGSNHYFADSVEDFKERIGEEFTLMTIPLVYNLKLNLEGSDYSIEDVYGNPSDGTDDSCVMKTETLFPSTGEDGAKGGVILAKLDNVKEDSEVRISATWEERDGEERSDVRTVQINSTEPDHYDSSDIRKSVVLQKYAETLRDWMNEYRRSTGSEWEHQSVEVHVSDEQRSKFETVLEFMRDNEDMIDDDISEEIETLETII